MPHATFERNFTKDFERIHGSYNFMVAFCFFTSVCASLQNLSFFEIRYALQRFYDSSHKDNFGEISKSHLALQNYFLGQHN